MNNWDKCSFFDRPNNDLSFRRRVNVFRALRLSVDADLDSLARNSLDLISLTLQTLEMLFNCGVLEAPYEGASSLLGGEDSGVLWVVLLRFPPSQRLRAQRLQLSVMVKQLAKREKDALAKKAAKDCLKTIPFTVKVDKELSPLPRNMRQKQREWILAGLKHLKAPVEP